MDVLIWDGVHSHSMGVRAEWSRCLGSVARRARDGVSPLRRSSAGWMPAKIGRLFAGVGRRHPVTIRKARWWQVNEAGVSSAAPDRSAALCCWMDQGKVALGKVVAPAPQPAASRVQYMMSTIYEVTWGISGTWVSCPTFSELCGLGTKGHGFVVLVDFQLTFIFLVEVKTANTAFVVLSLTCTSGGIHLQLPCLCFAPLPLFISLHQHAWLLGRCRMHIA